MRGLDILVVDDDRDLASGIAGMLAVDGHRAVLAGSGETALETARGACLRYDFPGREAARDDRHRCPA